MTSLKLLAAIAVIGAASTAQAESAVLPSQALEEGASVAEVRWDDFDDPSFEPGVESDFESGLEPAQVAARDAAADHREPGHVVVIGAEAIDSDGQRGRIHQVAAGDTLWDISEAYLGTPWVWPSVWNENDAIANPHLIVPGDQIWISSTEMRRLTQSEAAELLANQIPEPPVPVAEVDPNADSPSPLAPGSGDPSLSLASTPRGLGSTETGRSLTLPWRDSFGFVSSEVFEAASSIVGSPSARKWLAGTDLVYLGLGKGEVEVGEEFTVFRKAEAIRDTKTDALIGYHVNVLGWVRVVEVEEESAIARLEGSNSEIARGDRITPRDVRSPTVAIKRAQHLTRGRVVFMPAGRSVMGMGDYVYIDRGELDGLEVGSELEIFEHGYDASDHVRQSTVHTPDEIVATLVVVDLQPTSGVAYVTHSRRELEVGDSFRTSPMNKAIASVRQP